MAEPWWEREKWAIDLFQYVILIRAFLEGRLTGEEFSLLFFATLGTDDKFRPREISTILDALSAEIDDFCADDDLRSRAGGIDEQELRARVATAQEELRNVAAEHPQRPAG
ncbi:MAG TPA: colicin immunity domain-containing protein [Streptosporangiaceae bacterium]|nr:colicin immunity domain-containing protein [Streptosporangiaceae bacterium]